MINLLYESHKACMIALFSFKNIRQNSSQLLYWRFLGGKFLDLNDTLTIYAGKLDEYLTIITTLIPGCWV